MMSADTLASDPTLLQEEDFLEYALSRGFGELHFKVDKHTGMKAIVAIHSTKLGPALGGCRFISYPTTSAAIFDAMRLARSMSYKAALTNLPLGGGKAVMIKPAGKFDREAYLHGFGQFVEDLNGRYITALDSGTQLSDMDIIAQHTKHVASLSSYNGDPSPYTAKGILRGIQAAVLFQLEKENLEGLHVAIQGLGNVGYLLASYLHDLGVQLTVADINPERVKQAVDAFGAKTVATDAIHKIPCDVFAPCALGAIINDTSIEQLQTSIIAGAANNQLAHTYHGQRLHDKGILYATDYVINSGGLIYAASKYLQSAEEMVDERINDIKTTLLEIFNRAKKENKPVSVLADTIAQEKMARS